MADEKNLKVVVGLQRHHQGGYIQGVQEIHDGKLGDDPVPARLLERLGRRRRDLGPAPAERSQGDGIPDPQLGLLPLALRRQHRRAARPQHRHRQLGDGQGRRSPKKAHPVEANGMGGRVNRGNYGDIFDHHFVEFTYADGTKVFSQSRHQPGTWDEVSEFVHGTKGARSVAIGGGPKLESDNPYVQEHVDLIKAIAGDKKLNEGWHGAVSSMTAVLGRMATYSGQVVKWDEAVAKGPQEAPERIAWDAKPRSMPGEDGFYPFPIPA